MSEPARPDARSEDVPDHATRYALVELPLNLMQDGDVFQGANGEWFLIVSIDRMESVVRVAWKGHTKDIHVPAERVFQVLQPEGFFIAKSQLGGKWVEE